MTDPLRAVSALATPQQESARADQVQNAAGGYVFAVDNWTRLNRFLILGTEGGTYYVNERAHTLDNVAVVNECLAEDGVRVVKTLIEISEAGRAPRVNPTLFALAAACAAPHLSTRQAAFGAINRICRTGTHLFTFATYVQNQRGWGRGLRSAVASWYTDKPVDKLAYQAVKYRSRDGWTHRDLLRLAHPGSTRNKITEAADGGVRIAGSEKLAIEPARAVLFDFICGREVGTLSPQNRIVEGFLKAQAESDPRNVAKLVAEYHLPWEALQPDHLTSPEVWEAIIDSGIGITALIRNLARLTRIGVIKPLSGRASEIGNELTNVNNLKSGRVHPIAVLDALLTYGQGHGERGGHTWTPVNTIVEALNEAFYLAFQAVEPAGKRTLLGIDVSGSMTMGRVGGSAVLTPRHAAAAMAMVTAATEPEYQLMGFSSSFVELPITGSTRLQDAMRIMDGLPFARTDCALPMVWAAANKLDVDCFQTLTDNETWSGAVHPFQALRAYRNQSGIKARNVTVGMTSTGFSVNDPEDIGGLDIIGMDSATPRVIADFSAGRI